MLKNSEQLLIAILEDYSSGTMSMDRLAKRHGVSPRAMFMWARDPNLMVTFMGRTVTFGAAMSLARTVAKAVTVSESLEQYVRNGRETEVWFQGRPQYKEDEALVKLGED